MPELYYIGLDVHKKSISFCIKTGDGTIVQRGQVAATRAALTAWASALERPWVGALEATLFTGWIYDHLQPFAQELQVAHPAMLKAIACAKKKNDLLFSTQSRFPSGVSPQTEPTTTGQSTINSARPVQRTS